MDQKTTGSMNMEQHKDRFAREMTEVRLMFEEEQSKMSGKEIRCPTVDKIINEPTPDVPAPVRIAQMDKPATANAVPEMQQIHLKKPKTAPVSGKPIRVEATRTVAVTVSLPEQAEEDHLPAVTVPEKQQILVKGKAAVESRAAALGQLAVENGVLEKQQIHLEKPKAEAVSGKPIPVEAARKVAVIVSMPEQADEAHLAKVAVPEKQQILVKGKAAVGSRVAALGQPAVENGVPEKQKVHLKKPKAEPVSGKPIPVEAARKVAETVSLPEQAEEDHLTEVAVPEKQQILVKGKTAVGSRVATLGQPAVENGVPEKHQIHLEKPMAEPVSGKPIPVEAARTVSVAVPAKKQEQEQKQEVQRSAVELPAVQTLMLEKVTPAPVSRQPVNVSAAPTLPGMMAADAEERSPAPVSVPQLRQISLSKPDEKTMGHAAVPAAAIKVSDAPHQAAYTHHTPTDLQPAAIMVPARREIDMEVLKAEPAAVVVAVPAIREAAQYGILQPISIVPVVHMPEEPVISGMVVSAVPMLHPASIFPPCIEPAETGYRPLPLQSDLPAVSVLHVVLPDTQAAEVLLSQSPMAVVPVETAGPVSVQAQRTISVQIHCDMLAAVDAIAVSAEQFLPDQVAPVQLCQPVLIPVERKPAPNVLHHVDIKWVPVSEQLPEAPSIEAPIEQLRQTLVPVDISEFIPPAVEPVDFATLLGSLRAALAEEINRLPDNNS